ncbi:hypothetical protein [Streptomyces orinoci]|uniref:Uncharacterized protein n=1 Tax=Streptomyces orinoci TaxID=67339 RepID=A0ABV3JZQ1_STRON|nr:hypothetical protein [Streptomyces orinoci]
MQLRCLELRAEYVARYQALRRRLLCTTIAAALALATALWLLEALTLR